MLKIIRAILGVLIFLYLLLFIDAYLIGFIKNDEKITGNGCIISHGRGSASRYWIFTNRSKINVEDELYYQIRELDSITVYRSKLFGNSMKMDFQVGDFKKSYEVCYTRMTSGLILTSLFFLITIISFGLIKRGDYYPGKIGITILLLLLFSMTLYDHLYG